MSNPNPTIPAHPTEALAPPKDAADGLQRLMDAPKVPAGEASSSYPTSSVVITIITQPAQYSASSVVININNINIKGLVNTSNNNNHININLNNNNQFHYLSRITIKP
ncbi:hypothetical protein PGTUg99_037402 [Puccinia graminis f. sp. tritici]|uniref:Uncharacterized protein n=1 Tax=Puccinia graminis f. sp. tritici TaxID=56615 RepID=A0A5B0RBK3_PUCGR|nr:hypothetical protein PGTUg99_037402 [Puccinia graminis f. sp. tritici]